MSKTGKNIMIVGVGGQGTLLASRILGSAMLERGYDVKLSEVHGMSQRGGSVVTYVRYGDCVHSPVIQKGEADIILAFEELEAARALPCLKPDGLLVVNTQEIDPMPVITGKAQYPEKLVGKIEEKGIRVLALDALSLAQQAGNAKAVNVVLIGALAKHLGLEEQFWLDIICKTVPSKFVKLNQQAFTLGYQA